MMNKSAMDTQEPPTITYIVTTDTFQDQGTGDRYTCINILYNFTLSNSFAGVDLS